MRIFLGLIFSLCSLPIYSQTTLQFENRKIYLDEIDINNVYRVNFNYENKSIEDIEISYEPITNLVNTNFIKKTIAGKSVGSIKVNFYPEQEGPFNESLYIIVNGKDRIKLSIYGSVGSISKNYRSLTESNKLFGDREIAFMVVNSETFIGIPNSKVYIRNIVNQKSYIGIANRFGILLNKIPEGKYKIQALVNGYDKEILDIKLDANRNIAMILLEKKEPKDTFKKLEKPLAAKPKKVDTAPTLVASINSNEKENPAELRSTASIEESIIDNPPKEIDTLRATNSATPIIAEEEPEEINEPIVDDKIGSNRKPLNIILLIDVSKSMVKPNRIGVLKKSINNLIESYELQDHMAILTFNDKVTTLMKRMNIRDKEKAKSLINSILPSGITDGVLGIERAFEILQENYMKDAINMVILATDGRVNKYASDDKLMLEKIEKMNAHGILTSVVGFGTTNHYQNKLKRIAQLGGGLFIDMKVDSKDIESSLVDEIYSTLLKLN